MLDDEFERAIENYGNLVLRIAMSSLNNMEDAKDVTQDVFIKLYKQDSFQSEEHLKRWLIKVSYNATKDLHRRLFRKDEYLEEDFISTLDPKLLDIKYELSKLSQEERVLIYLYYFEGYTYQEIGDILGKSIHTISSKVQRAIKKLNLMVKEDLS